MTSPSPLLGTYTLLSYTSSPFDHHGPTIHPMGPDARGLLTYAADGYMAVNVMPTSSNKVKHSIQDGVMYTGRFWVEEAGGDQDGHRGRGRGGGLMVSHQVHMACPHELEGSVLKRQVTWLEGDRLKLSSLGFVDIEGLMVRPELVWERISRP
ncbi:hypothetical protein BO70DRAFT_430054 [Aspergillus heteromorphus CBS 117.55]|uniref:Lipocalin-like domain-containing protein n=1 Tax=Aspergillus heteromorphus CBS 117.55 TaxID=1448321 RepID=A0A317VY27_9EURO|nr:uncharacterized protein BO70DRAFT_430054 [Aspergillus heteromorphus CBS 117.55]PWY79264.1 hypothetical protein BO70DRAFT_430054 [Aspergillus heteromorphus CBS 117.55]